MSLRYGMEKIPENYPLVKSYDRMSLKSLSNAGDGKTSTRLNVGQMKYFTKGKEYWIHPVYDLYGANKKGEVINIDRGVPMKGNYANSGYLMVGVRGSGVGEQKTVQAHRFVYECYNGLIPDGMVIDHINDIKDDNRVKNLQLMTQQKNCKKSAAKRDYSFAAKNNENRKFVKAINLETNEATFYNSLYATQQHLGVNCGIVSMCCQGINNVKSGTSKKDNCRYRFEYVKKEEMPDDYFKSANIRPRRVSDEDKKKHLIEWYNREYICLRCNKVMKNKNRQYHIKKCEKFF